MPHKTRQLGSITTNKKKGRAPALPERVPQNVETLFSDDHLFYKHLAVNFKSKEVDPRRHIRTRLGRFPVPIRDVFTGAAGQQQIFKRLAAPRVSNTALQYRHRNQLCQQVVYPQTNAVLPSRINATLIITDRELDPRIEGDWVRVVLVQLESGALSPAGLG